MKCHMCSVDKLSREFPPIKVTEECRHPRFFCMRCVIAYVGQHSKCPLPSCGQPVSPDSHVIKCLESTLDHMFAVYTSDYTPPCTSEAASQGIIRVAVLNGDSIDIIYNPQMTIFQLKQEIKVNLKHEVQKQKLLYNDKELTVYGDTGLQLKLSDYQIQANSTIHLVVLLFAIPKHFDHVVFDLYWGFLVKMWPVESVITVNYQPGWKEVKRGEQATYTKVGTYRPKLLPSGKYETHTAIRKRAYLDASCFVFSGMDFLEVFDYRSGKIYGSTSPHASRQNKVCADAIMHSGDSMNDIEKTGHQIIHVHLKKIPSNVTHLFFTLSAYDSSNISKYPNPTLRFYEASDKTKDLCSTALTQDCDSEAVVMCSVSRSSRGWEIYNSGKSATGNAKNYDDIIDTLKSLILQGF